MKKAYDKQLFLANHTYIRKNNKSKVYTKKNANKLTVLELDRR